MASDFGKYDMTAKMNPVDCVVAMTAFTSTAKSVCIWNRQAVETVPIDSEFKPG